jgi:hypothetical protein
MIGYTTPGERQPLAAKEVEMRAIGVTVALAVAAFLAGLVAGYLLFSGHEDGRVAPEKAGDGRAPLTLEPKADSARVRQLSGAAKQARSPDPVVNDTDDERELAVIRPEDLPRESAVMLLLVDTSASMFEPTHLGNSGHDVRSPIDAIRQGVRRLRDRFEDKLYLSMRSLNEGQDEILPLGSARDLRSVPMPVRSSHEVDLLTTLERAREFLKRCGSRTRHAVLITDLAPKGFMASRLQKEMHRWSDACLTLSTVGLPGRETQPSIGEILVSLAAGGRGRWYYETRPERIRFIMKRESDRILESR